MNSYAQKTITYFIITLILVVAYFVVLIPQAEAKIVVDGSREFTDDVNNCLNTYRGAEGVVGDVIKELENSDNEHKIINSPDWNNIINNVDDAFNGKGTGTVTRVDKVKLEDYKKKIPALANKDFCTALLHELWHAVDADRGEWTTDKIDGVKRNEVEAVAFQNLIHAIRGVPPRTAYGGKDISKHVIMGGEEPKEEVKNLEPAPKTEVKVATSFNHVKPGEYSEIYATVTASPGASVEVKLSGPGVSGEPTQNIKADDKGVAKFTWRIVSYGDYKVTGTSEGQEFSSNINVK